MTLTSSSKNTFKRLGKKANDFFVLFSAKNKDILKTIYTWITEKYEASSNILYNESMKKFY